MPTVARAAPIALQSHRSLRVVHVFAVFGGGSDYTLGNAATHDGRAKHNDRYGER